MTPTIDITELDPSELLELALGDLAKAERSPHYDVEMETWHTPRHWNARCEVCFAGAVMAFSLNMERDIRFAQIAFDDATVNALYALDEFRRGDSGEALELLGVPNALAYIPLRIDIPEYQCDRRGFKKAIRTLIADLKEVGL